MGSSKSKDKIEDDSLENLLIENSDDKYINYIEGILYINKILKEYILIYFYEDYLYIKGDNIDNKVSYYLIKYWEHNMKRNIFTFYKKNNNNLLDKYTIYIDKMNNENNISEELLDIIKNHIDYKKNL